LAVTAKSKSSGKSSRSSSSVASSRVGAKHAHRRFIVFSSLIGVLTLTSALLLALAPAPLAPDAVNSLLAVDGPAPLDEIFQTNVPAAPDKWKYVYVHHSRTPSGNASTLAQGNNSPLGMGDHFVIGNGYDAVDGEIQIGQRWMQQKPATPPPGAAKIDAACISICLIGDFDRTVPTPTQLSQLARLVSTLQGRYQIKADQIVIDQQVASPAGIGKYFPATAFRGQLLR
jgi:hypothetical protein